MRIRWQHLTLLTTFLFGTKGAKRKVIGQKHSRLEHERVARAQYSLFFPIFASASSSTGRADVKIKRKSSQKRNAEKEISLVATSDQGSAFGNRKPLKRLDRNFPAALSLPHIIPNSDRGRHIGSIKSYTNPHSSSFGSFLERKEQ